MEEKEPRTMPDDPAPDISQAITFTESAARKAFDYGRFWMANHDHAHGRRWFARMRELEQIAIQLRRLQLQVLHPKPVDTPTRNENAK